MNIFLLSLFLVLMLFFFILGFFLRKLSFEKNINSAQAEAKKILEQAVHESEAKKKEIIIEGKDELFNLKQEAEKEITKMRSEIIEQEKHARQREDIYNKKVEAFEVKEKKLEEKVKKVQENLSKIEEIKSSQVKKLEEISKMTQDQAQKHILEILENDLVHERSIKINEHEQILSGEKNKLARNILSLAMQRLASDHVMQTSVSMVVLPNEEMKGRIIGREGRNIRAIETLGGIDLIIDDTPETIAISSFDPMRREIAKRALESLIADGRIHPAKIEEEILRAKDEIQDEIQATGQKIILEVGLRGVGTEIIKLLGQLKYRTSYGQNVLKHSLEVAYISGMIASELGADVAIAKRCGLLHDIGKALTHESDGSHVELGVEIAKRNKESKNVIEAINYHHTNIRQSNYFVAITQAADAISAARPGARRENLENYIKRLQKLETIVSEFPGVEKCYAIQAGREIRVMINPEKISDEKMVILAREVSKKLESDLTYPGQIKINLIRESVITEYAR